MISLESGRRIPKAESEYAEWSSRRQRQVEILEQKSLDPKVANALARATRFDGPQYTNVDTPVEIDKRGYLKSIKRIGPKGEKAIQEFLRKNWPLL